MVLFVAGPGCGEFLAPCQPEPSFPLRHEKLVNKNHRFMNPAARITIIGAGLALLWAPRSGPELRQMIGEQADSIRGDLARRVRDVADRVTHGLDDLHDRVDRYAERAEADVREVRSRVGEHAG